MKKTKLIANILVIFCFLVIPGCNCRNAKNQELAQKEATKFTLSPQLLASWSKSGYSYRSSLNLNLSNNNQELINNEVVNILATPQRIYMTKKIDGSHFLEIMSDNNSYFVKSRSGDWRSGDSNKAHFRALISDALNVLAWLNEQCMLGELFVKRGKFLEIINQPIPKNAALIKLMQSTPSESLINGRIELDKNNIPINASFNINISNIPEFKLKLELELSIQNTSTVIPDLPVLAQDELLLYPVNIATRFKSLMSQ